MDRNATTKQIVQYLQMSTLEPKEKAMWFLLLPHMDDDQLTKLSANLEKETSVLTDMYLQSLQQKNG